MEPRSRRGFLSQVHDRRFPNNQRQQEYNNEEYQNRNKRKRSNSQQRREYSNERHDRRSSTRIESTSTTRSNASSSSSSYSMLTQMLDKQPNEILAEMIQINFSIKQFLNDKRMETEKDWIVTITKLFERITTCTDTPERLQFVLKQIPNTVYVEGVYNAVRQLDSKTNQLCFGFLQSFLNMSNKFLALLPHLAIDLEKIFERIELAFTKIDLITSEVINTKVILDQVLKRKIEIEQPNQSMQIETMTTTVQLDNDTELDNYRKLSIIPKLEEILYGNRPILQKNIIDGVYNNPEHYLDANFVGPLREGIQQYLSGSQDKNYNVCIYKNVHLYGSKVNSRSVVIYDLSLDRQMALRFSWANCRRLMYGNLLVLSNDNFQTCTFVTIENRDQIEKTFCISVRKLENINLNQNQLNLDEINPSCSLIMIETMTYFEAYRPVLNALQTIAVDQTFPLEPFILKLNNESIPPDYVTSTTTYDFTPLLVEPKSKVEAVFNTDPISFDHIRALLQRLLTKKFHINYKQSDLVPEKYKSVNILDINQWPTSDEVHLNSKQHEALISALTRKVALIQGPPGTGKTYLGVRIVEMLLYNRSVWCPSSEQSTPILLICQTNHALDQFLELIKNRLNLTEGIIRVGSRCKNEAIEPFSLSNARKRVRNNRSMPNDIYHQRQFLLKKKFACDEILKQEDYKIEQSRTIILPFSSFIKHDIINLRHFPSLSAPYEDVFVERAILDWLGLGDEHKNSSEESVFIKNWKQKISELDINSNEEAYRTKTYKNKQFAKNVNRIEQNEEEEEERRRDEIELDDDYFASPIFNESETRNLEKMTSEKILSINNNKKYETHGVIKKHCNRNRIVQLILEHPTTLTDETVQQLPDDILKLTINHRYDLYRYWLLKYQNHCHSSIRNARQEYDKTITELDKHFQNEDYYILKDSLIVAMTTTGAAKHHAILEKLQSKIVIVEEAAAIFEAHIVTALTSKCEHLILIGDHIQLRPTPNVYNLGVKYHLDVSLFERFVRNNFPSVRLNIQHRMRPEISRVMKHFYDDLEDHESVLTERPDIRGVENSVFFISHDHMEMNVDDGSSKRNEFEARYIVELAKYFIKQGYQPNQITILVMYLGQRQCIAKLMGFLKGLRIMVVDNYQGEENDIILLSLVRSNAEKSIGFLKIHNRICVALSRARCGLFVIGNMNFLAEVEGMWKKIVDSLAERNAIGQGLTLSCHQHPEEKFIADTPESFEKRPRGGCNKLCMSRLKCGHQCELLCHNYDIEHMNIVCRKKCIDQLPCGHPCTKNCHHSNPTQHDPCRILVEKTITECGHKIKCRCAETPTVQDCQELILKRLVCNHVVELICSTASSDKKLEVFSCPTSCDAILACGHKCKGTCGQCRSKRLHIPCQEKCTREFICSHVCKASCTANCPPCTRKCETLCVHSKCQKRCCDPCPPCREPCMYKCKHLQCTRLCSEPCNRGPCNKQCNKKLKCGHYCIGICGEPCPKQCRICDKSVVQEILFGTEDEPDACFVSLPDCGHLIEVTALDRVVFDSINNSADSTAIRFPVCPLCKTQIRQCMRYMPVINQVQDLIEQVKKKILGSRSEHELKEKRNCIIRKYKDTRANLKQIEYSQITSLFSKLKSGDFLRHEILILIENILIFIKTIDNLLNKGKKMLTIDVFKDQIHVPLMNILKYILAHEQSRNFAEQQIQDIQSEFERIRCVIIFESFDALLKQQNPIRDLKPNEIDSIETIKKLVRKSGRFRETNKKEFFNEIEKVKHLENIPGLGINERERKAIVTALNMGKGHWYVCPKGHPYVITECGGAMEESNCPECGEQIGGKKHQLVSTNRHFGTMDGSTYASWSDEANANMRPPF
ncbi:unnamed protein product [Adineta steineri]|uniref:RZ-type domain-containing protein n=1 Tax=Adineta steineri TaxID=433720 RepID=A0A819QB52_9BILA|nr:unnamed protein product [Adineta steineri]